MRLVCFCEHKTCLKTSDEVLAFDTDSGAKQGESVTAPHINRDTDLTVTTADGEITTIHTTQHHPFWSATRHEWVDAADLQPQRRFLKSTVVYDLPSWLGRLVSSGRRGTGCRIG